MNSRIQRFRKHLRISGFDYRENHAYFVTVVTGRRECAFGSIEQGAMRPTRRGLIAQQCWCAIPQHHPFVELDAFIIMPNHLHGVLLFVGNEVAMQQQISVAATPVSPRGVRGPASQSLGAVIGSFKSAVSREINRLRPGAANRFWQPNYYEHIIRNDRGRDVIRDYILSNSDRWNKDCENPQSDGTDDFDAFIRSLDRLDLRTEGDAGVAATGRAP